MTVTAVAPLRIGVIGVGRIGRMHAGLIAHQVPGAALGAVFDSHEPLARDVAAELGVPAAGAVQDLSENPRTHSGTVVTAEGERRPPNSYFFLERYLPSYVREWEAFVDAVRRGEDPPVSTTDARAPLVIGLAAGRSLREGRSVRIAEITA